MFWIFFGGSRVHEKAKVEDVVFNKRNIVFCYLVNFEYNCFVVNVYETRESEISPCGGALACEAANPS